MFLFIFFHIYVSNFNFILALEHHTVPVPLNFKCERIWNDRRGTFNFNVSWSIPDSEYLSDVIVRFQIKLYLLTGNYRIFEVPFTVSQLE